MAQEFGFLVKVFSQEKYRDDFLDGKFYMNPISFFKNYEEKTVNNIGDKNEAVRAWLQPHELSITFKPPGMEEFTIPGKDIAAPIVIRSNVHDNYNVLCLTLLHSHGIDISEGVTDEEIELLKGYFHLPEEAMCLGGYAVVIPNFPRFIERIRSAAQALISSEKASSFLADKVKYYDKSKTLSLLNDHEPVFHKQSDYEHQSEFRLCLDRGVSEPTPYTFDVGDIRDLANPCLTSEVNSMFSLDIKKI
jgi:hypothetical protein